MKTSEHDARNIVELTWRDVRNDVKKVNQGLVKIIDELPLTKEHTLIKIPYPYGTKILNNGVLQWPNHKGHYVSYSDPCFDSKLVEKCQYSPVPVSVLLDKSIEVYVETPDRVVPLSLLSKGVVFGLWETLDPKSSLFIEKLWQITSGARTVFMLPKISDAICHKKIQKQFKTLSGAPKDIIGQWNVFREITSSPASSFNWSTDILIFTKAWFDKKYRRDQQWRQFDYYLLNTAWLQSSHWRSRMYFEIIWEAFSLDIVKRNLRPTQNQINTVKHLIGIGTGIFPGFRPALNDEAAPVSDLQNVYLEIYGLKEYAPIIMQPWQFLDDQCNEPVYYSLNFPTQLDFISKNIRSTLEELRAIMRLNDTMMSRVKIEEKMIFKMMQSLEFNYYHSEPDELNQIKTTGNILKDDKQLSDLISLFKSRKFPTHASFLRGCIAISNSQKPVVSS